MWDNIKKKFRVKIILNKILRRLFIMKKTIIVAAIAAVMVTSISSYAATNINQKASNESTQNLAVESNSAEVTNNQEKSNGNIEYTKMTFTTEKDGASDITETWVNPKTFDFRQDIIRSSVESESEIPKTGDAEKDAMNAKKMAAAGNAPKYVSTYFENSGKQIVNIIRDDNGNPIKGNKDDAPQEEANSNVQNIQKNQTFAAMKSLYANPADWKDEGTETTSDGKVLKKISSGDKNGEEMHLLYLNEDGLPVKSELYINGQLAGVGTMEYKLVQDDGKIFDTSGVKLEPLNIDRSK